MSAVRRLFGVLAIAAGLGLCGPAQAADLGVDGGYGYEGVVHSGPIVLFDYEPGIRLRAYWVTPWAGRHYYPAAGKMPAVGRLEKVEPTPVSGKRNFQRSWSSFPVDTIEQPPLVYAPSYSNGGQAPLPGAPPAK